MPEVTIDIDNALALHVCCQGYVIIDIKRKRCQTEPSPMGTAGQLMDEVCAYLGKVERQIEVWRNVILNRSTESTASGKLSVIL